jgi:purine-nucleoside phosphorylase
MTPEKIEEAQDYLTHKGAHKPQVGMILGTGLGGIAEKIDVDLRLPYEEIPHFPRSTIEGHKGSLVFGTIGNRRIMTMEGRFHLYEGYHVKEITFPIRVMAKLGVRTLLISSAAGGLNPLFKAGDLMLVTDHINLSGTNPLQGPNLDDFGPRFPDMSDVYDPLLREKIKLLAIQCGIDLKQGIYVGIMGPSLETPAETRFLRAIGADAVGMSTVSEVIVAVHCGIKIAVIVAITNVNLPDCMTKTSIEAVIEAANRAGPSLSHLWEKVIATLPLDE